MIDVKEKVKSAYTAHSKRNFYVKKLISSYVLENNKLLLSFLNDYNNSQKGVIIEFIMNQFQKTIQFRI